MPEPEGKLFYRWAKTKSEQRTKATDGTEIKVKIAMKEKVEATIEEMINTLLVEMTDFRKNRYPNYHQQAQHTKMKGQLSTNKCILIIAFNEIYLCKYGSET